MKNITLRIHGQQRSFSEEELTAIVEDYYSNKELVEKPTEGKWFEVNPKTIKKELFEETRTDLWEEFVRCIILDAFDELKNNPERYAKTFEIYIPEKKWEVKTVEELKEIASNIGDHMQNWVELGLEWAQRISNGKSWDSICKYTDMSKWHRAVIWKNGLARIIGGSYIAGNRNSESELNPGEYKDSDRLSSTVPKVVRYKKVV